MVYSFLGGGYAARPITSLPARPITNTYKPITSLPARPITNILGRPITSLPAKPLSSTPAKPLQNTPAKSLASAASQTPVNQVTDPNLRMLAYKAVTPLGNVVSKAKLSQIAKEQNLPYSLLTEVTAFNGQRIK